MRLGRKNKGQTIVEFALAMILLFVIFFFFIDFCFWLVERSVAQYAAFMSARSYQVYGKYNGLFKQVGGEIIGRSFPWSGMEGMASAFIKVDTEYTLTQEAVEFNTGGGTAGIRVNKQYLLYGVLPRLYTRTNLRSTAQPRYGLLRIKYPFQSRTGLSRLLMNPPPGVPLESWPFSYIKVVVPYRLEPGVEPCNGQCG